MVEFLGENNSVFFLGEDVVTEAATKKRPEPFKSSDLESIVVSGKTVDETTPEDIAATVQETNNHVLVTVDKTINEKEDPEKALGKLNSTQRKQNQISPTDYWAMQLEAFRNDELPDLAALSASKIQYTVDAINKASEDQSNRYGVIANFADRVLRDIVYESWVKVFKKDDFKEAEKIFGAISGTMSLEEYKKFFDGIITDYSKQGIFIDSNPMAFEELRTIALSLGDTDPMTINFLFALLDVVPSIGGLAKTGIKGGKAVATATVTKEVAADAKAIAQIAEDLAKSPTTAARVGAVAESKEVAEEAAKKIALKTDDPENLADLGPAALNPVSPNAPYSPTINAAIKDTRLKELTKEVYDYAKRALGSAFDESSVAAYVSKRQKALDNFFNRSLSDFSLDLRTGVLRATIGHYKTGLPVTKRTAEKIAAKSPEAKVIPVNAEKNQYLVQVEEVLNTDKFIRVADDTEQLSTMVSRLTDKLLQATKIASAHAVDNKTLANLAERAETGVVKLGNIAAKALGKDINKLSSKELDQVGKVVNKLQSEELASQRTWLTEEQFVKEWVKQNGSMPSQKVVKGYNAFVDASNLAYVMKSGMLIQRLHREGVRRITVKLNETVVPMAAKKHAAIPDNVEFVVDAATGRLDRLRDLKKNKSFQPKNVFEVDMDIQGGYGSSRWVYNADTIRPLEPEDVLGFNAGGPRINPEAQYFLAIQSDTDDIVDIILSTSTKKEAQKATEEIGRLMEALKKGTITDEMVEKNTSWNKYINTKEDFIKFVSDAKLDVNKVGKVVFKIRDDIVYKSADGQAFVNGGSLDEFVTFSQRRSNKPLTHYGGEPTFNENPVKSIQSQLNTASRQLAYSQYNTAAEVSLGRKVKEIVNKSGGAKDYIGWTDRDYLDVLDSPKLANTQDPMILKLKELKRIFEMRKGVKTEGEKWLANAVNNATEGLTGGKVRLDSLPNIFNKYGFYSTFILDPFQFILQGMHSINIVAMAGLDDGIRGAALGYYTTRSLGLKQGAELDLWYARMAKQFDMSIQDMKDIRQIFIDSARYEINPEVMAEGFTTGASTFRPRSNLGKVALHSTKKNWDVASKYGMFFFNKGEQMSRVTAFGASIMKFKGKNPGVRFNSEQARKFITDKEQAYTLRMTQTNKGQIQHGLMRVPLQFYTFLFRSFESIFVGRGLTGAERLKLAGILMPMYGTVGVGIVDSESVKEAINYVLPEDMKITSDSFTYDLIKRGPIDAITEWAGVGTAIAERLSVSDGVKDTIRGFQEDTLIEAVLGAGGGKTMETGSKVFSAFANLVSGNTETSKIKLAEAFRNVKFIDNAAKIRGIMFDDVLRTKTGKQIHGLDITMGETIALALGIPIKEVEEHYDAMDLIYASGAEYKRVSKGIEGLINEFWQAVEDGNENRSIRLTEEIESVIRWSSLTEVQKGSIRMRLFNGPTGQFTWDMYKKLLDLGLVSEAERYANSVGN